MIPKSHACALMILLAAAGEACAASKTSTEGFEQQGGSGGGGGSETACVPGHQTTCACANGNQGVQICKEDGSGFGKCDCSLVTGPGGSGGGGGSEPCGDDFCDDGEDCHNCIEDCGVCKPCDIAPSCDNAFVPPADVPHLTDFDIPKMEWVSPEKIAARLQQAVAKAGPEMRLLAAALADERAGEHPLVGALRQAFADNPAATAAVRRQLGRAGMKSALDYRAAFPELLGERPEWHVTDVTYPGGTMECGAPMLRVGVSKITVHEEDDDWANDIVYCVLQAEAKTGAEIRVTPKTPNLDEGDSYSYSLEAGVFWGQLGPTTPAGDMLLTYDCIEADTSDGYQNLINAIGGAATQVGDVIPGDNGWIFSTIGAIAPIVSGSLALDGDDALFNAQQSIPLDRQLELSNGAYWTVRRAGTHLNSDWDWELFVKVWGCAEYGEKDKV